MKILIEKRKETNDSNVKLINGDSETITDETNVKNMIVKF